MSTFEIIGHRGFPSIAPENTLISFQRAIDAGVDMVECDVTLSKDGEVVVIHDDTLDRTTNGRGKIQKKSLAELRSLDAGTWFSPEFRGEKIPLLSELLDLVRGKCIINIEIKEEAVHKKDTADGIEAKVVSLVEAHRMEKSVIVSSFYPLAIERVKRIAPSIRTALLLWRTMMRKPAFYQKRYMCDDIHLNAKKTKKIHVQGCVEAGIPVRIYTVNDVKKAETLREWGVTGIFTDVPARMIEKFR